MGGPQLLLLPILLLVVGASHSVGGQLSGVGQYRQHNNVLEFQVPENAPAQYLGQVRSAEGKVPSLILAMKPTTELELQHALTYNTTTGDLYTVGPLDREKIERFHFLAMVTDPFTEVRCTLRVTDLNDNAPAFVLPQNETEFLIEVPENQLGVRRNLPLAYDLDSPANGIKEFQLKAVQHAFSLVEHGAPARSALLQGDSSNGGGGVGGSGDESSFGPSPFNSSGVSTMASENPHLMSQLAQLASVLIPSQPGPSTLTQGGGQFGSQQPIAQSAGPSSGGSKYAVDIEVNEPLDRENQSIYNLDVTVSDGGPVPLVTKLKVIVKVLDVNDNDPIFVQKLYECRVKEDEPVNGRALLRVEAHDADEGANANITYSIKTHTSSSSSSQSTQTTNSSDNNNNEVSTLATGRFSGSASSANNNKRTVQQQQQSAQANTGKLTLRSQQDQQQQQHGSVELGNNNPSLVNNGGGKQFKANFGGLTSSGMVQEQLFRIDPNSGDIYLAHSLDFESDQWHELIVEARDHGKPARSGNTIVKVFVVDVMDDPPVPSLSRAVANDKSSGNSNGVLNPSSEASRSEVFSGGHPGNSDNSDTMSYFQNFNLLNWFAQINSSVLFIFVLVALIIVAFPVCFVKIKSLQPESDHYNDTAGLTHHSKIHPNASPLPATPNTTNSSGLPPNHLPKGSTLLPPLVPSSVHQPPQLPPTPCHAGASVFAWSQTPNSTFGRRCLPLVSHANPGQLTHGASAHGSLLDCTPSAPQHVSNNHLQRYVQQPWLDLGGSIETQPSMAHHDLYSPYHWDYLSDWAPKYKTVINLMQADASYYSV